MVQISGAQFKQAGALFNGYVQFACGGDAGRKHGALDTTPDDNIIRFKKRQQAEVEKAMELIDHYRARRA